MSFDDCATQRQLSDKGRANSRAIGEAIRALDVPIGSVLASPLCRTVETAMLAFGSAEKSMATRDGVRDPVGSTKRFAALRRLLSTAPPAGKNTVIVAHGYPYYALTHKGQMLEEGEAAIVRPHGTSFEEVARLGLKGGCEVTLRRRLDLLADQAIGQRGPTRQGLCKGQGFRHQRLVAHGIVDHAPFQRLSG